MVDWVGPACIRYFHSIGPFCTRPWGPHQETSRYWGRNSRTQEIKKSSSTHLPWLDARPPRFGTEGANWMEISNTHLPYSVNQSFLVHGQNYKRALPKLTGEQVQAIRTCLSLSNRHPDHASVSSWWPVVFAMWHFRQRAPYFRQRAPHFRQRAPHFRQRAPHFRQRAPHFRINESDIIHTRTWTELTKSTSSPRVCIGNTALLFPTYPCTCKCAPKKYARFDWGSILCPCWGNVWLLCRCEALSWEM